MTIPCHDCTDLVLNLVGLKEPQGNLRPRFKINHFFLIHSLKSKPSLPSSPIRTPLIDNEIVLMNTLYKERFPKATQQVMRYSFVLLEIGRFIVVSYTDGGEIAELHPRP